jgi:probable rRNA maturation factor
VRELNIQAGTVSLPMSQLQIKKIVDIAFKTAKVSVRGSQLTIRFVGSAESRSLNQQFRNKDYATNVLTFNYQSEPVMADIVICTPVLRREAKEQRKTLIDHLTHLLIHGVFHALGMDHETERQANQMESLEIALLAKLGVANPYLA